MDIGIKIKDLRLRLNLTQEELADRCELTKGYISQLENDLTSPSISTLIDILSALGTNLKEFFSGARDEKKVFTEKDYITKESADNIITWLVPNSQKNMIEPILMTLSGTFEDMPHEGEEFGYILEGSVTLIIGGTEHKLNKGETFYYVSDKTHSLRADGKTAKILWISTPPNF